MDRLIIARALQSIPKLEKRLFDSDSNFTCAKPIPGQHGDPLGGINVSAKTVMTYMALACLGLTSISAVFLIWKHLHRYTMPKEQRQNVRIIFMPVFLCIISVLSIHFYEDSLYLKPLNEVYEAFGVAALFLLYVEYIVPDDGMRPKFFDNAENRDRKGKVIPGGSLRWFNRIWFTVFQFPFTKTLSCIVEIITQYKGVYCTNSLSPKYAHIWLLAIDLFIIGGAVSSVFRFYARFRTDFDPKHHSLAKLVSFKGIVIFQFLQEIIFGILNGKLFKPSAKLTYDDIYYGVPMALTAVEALCFSLAFHWAFCSREYHEDHRAGIKRLPIWKATFDSVNPTDLLRAMAHGFTVMFSKSSPNGRGIDGDVKIGPLRFGGKGPQRQRTRELDSMGLEPLDERQWQRSPSPVPQAYVDQRGKMYQVPSQSPPAYPQYPGHLRQESGEQRLGLMGGHDEYRTGYARSRDPLPSGGTQQMPRDMV